MALIKLLRPTGTGILSDETHTGTGASGAATLGASTPMRQPDDFDGCFLETFAGEFDQAASTARFEYANDTAGAPWSITSIKIRAQLFIDNQTAYWRPSINGVNRGSEQTVTITPTWFEQEFTTDPEDSQPWTAAKLNAKTFGAYIRTECSALATMGVTLDALQVEVHGVLLTTGAPAVGVGEAVAGGVATLITLGAVAGCVGEAITGSHTSHGHTHGTVAEVVGEALERDFTSSPPPPYVPVITSLGVLRPTLPMYGDDSDIPYFGDNQIETWVGEALSPGTSSELLLGSAFNTLPDTSGTIDYITVNLYGWSSHNVGLFSPVGSTQLLVWTIGGDSDSAPMLPAVGPETPPDPFESPLPTQLSWSEAFKYGTGIDRASAPIYTQPNGAPWTWGALANLADVGLSIVAPSEVYLTAFVSEIWVEVYGTPAATPKPVDKIMTFPARRIGGSVELPGVSTGITIRKQIGGSITKKVVIRS